ncbi:DUF6477 family protein [Alisedimentitalea sp. MJ-SS2]|uniref:DUF6477 family protein n=1 Tax=Aliisedimentitalea sp. MJ-SS2 TaxID=3049795 RepID=UPI002906D569|nr:DUF6477 family protein [Alisedimentitalea sp. MJ-SS2]MDU8926880.1 DUF6477 family protein [Alisedimentitalea sp. MJ-SS2]
MTDFISILDRLHRPRLLIQAARAGCEDYRRAPHLRRLLGQSDLPRHREALAQLIEIEDGMNQQRQAGENGYSLVAHVDVLIAMMAEAQLVRALNPAEQAAQKRRRAPTFDARPPKPVFRSSCNPFYMNASGTAAFFSAT